MADDDSKIAAREALYTHIVSTLGEAENVLGAAQRASAIKDLAIAYRLLAGGTQPGSSLVSG